MSRTDPPHVRAECHRLLTSLLVRHLPTWETASSRCIARMDALSNLAGQAEVAGRVLESSKAAAVTDPALGGLSSDDSDPALRIFIAAFPDLPELLAGKIRIAMEQAAHRLAMEDLGVAPGFGRGEENGGLHNSTAVEGVEEETAVVVVGPESPATRRAPLPSTPVKTGSPRHGTSSPRTPRTPTASSPPEPPPSLSTAYGSIAHAHRRALQLLSFLPSLPPGARTDTTGHFDPTDIPAREALDWIVNIGSMYEREWERKVTLAREIVDGAFSSGRPKGGGRNEDGSDSDSDSNWDSDGGGDGAGKKKPSCDVPPFDYDALRARWTDTATEDWGLIDLVKDRVRLMERARTLDKLG